MKHNERELLSAYLDGELAAAERAEVSAHLARCAECARELGELALVEKTIASSRRHVMPPELLARLEARFSRRTWAERAAGLLKAPRFYVPAGAVAAFAVALSFWLGAPEPEQIPLESLLAAHTRYSSEGLVPQENLTQPEFISHLSASDAE